MSDLMASHKVMRHYLNALLTEEIETKPKVNSVEKQQLSALLASVSTDAITQVSKAPVQTSALIAKHSDTGSKVDNGNATRSPRQDTAVFAVEKPVSPRTTSAHLNETELKNLASAETSRVGGPPSTFMNSKEYRQGKFQALFFEVAGLKVALPLKELGGIHKITTLNTLPSKPQWYRGVMLYREQKINVVDTARWVMPEKYDDKLQETINYQYVIMLGKSSWGLACETLINTVTLEQEDVKWRSNEGKRPWLAGLIKQHMCALLDVDAMVALLAQGAGSSD
jgi:purine-binding chemotaxis protein CheW